MKVKYILNNYQIGAKLQSAPTHKLIRKERIDRSHTEVVFEISEGQLNRRWWGDSKPLGGLN